MLSVVLILGGQPNWGGQEVELAGTGDVPIGFVGSCTHCSKVFACFLLAVKFQGLNVGD